MKNPHQIFIVLSIFLLIAMAGALPQKPIALRRSIGYVPLEDNNKDDSQPIVAAERSKSISVGGNCRKFNLIGKTFTEFHIFPFPAGAPRTFHRIQKLQSALLPLMFKLGIMASVLVAILFISLKTLLIGKILLLINLAGVLAKLIAFGFAKGHHQDNPLQKEIHLHIHNSNPHTGGGYIEHNPWSASSNSFPSYVSPPYGTPSSPYGSNSNNFQPIHSRADQVGPTSASTGYYIRNDSTLVPMGKKKKWEPKPHPQTHWFRQFQCQRQWATDPYH